MKVVAVVVSVCVILIIAVVLALVYGLREKAVDCQVSEWSACDPITKQQTRIVTQAASGKGQVCPALSQSCTPISFEGSTASRKVADFQAMDQIGAVDCGTDHVLQNVKVVKDGDNYNYKYTCVARAPHGLEQETERQLVPQIVHDSRFLDRFDVQCGNSNALGAIRNTPLDRPNSRYIVGCSTSTTPKTCRVSSSSIPNQGGVAALSALDTKCAADEYLSQFRYTYGNNASTYNYTCCK